MTLTSFAWISLFTLVLSLLGLFVRFDIAMFSPPGVSRFSFFPGTSHREAFSRRHLLKTGIFSDFWNSVHPHQYNYGNRMRQPEKSVSGVARTGGAVLIVVAYRTTLRNARKKCKQNNPVPRGPVSCHRRRHTHGHTGPRPSLSSFLVQRVLGQQASVPVTVFPVREKRPKQGETLFS